MKASSRSMVSMVAPRSSMVRSFTHSRNSPGSLRVARSAMRSRAWIQVELSASHMSEVKKVRAERALLRAAPR